MAQDSRGFGLWMVSSITFCVMAGQSIMGGNGGGGREGLMVLVARKLREQGREA